MTSVDSFRKRFSKLFKAWQDGTVPGFIGADAVAISTGVYEPDADIGYLKSFAIVTWLFGAELQGAAVIFSVSEVVLAFAPQDLSALSPLAFNAADSLPKITVLSTENTAFATTAKRIAAGAKSVAVLSKEVRSQEGDAAKVVAEISQDNHINVASAIAAVLAVKDGDEEKKVKKAAYLSAHVMKGALVQRIEKTIDQDRKTSHASLSETAEEAIMNPSKVKLGALKPESCDPCFPPIIQSADARTSSARKFDLRPSAESNEDCLAFGCIVASIGARFNFYCSNVSRTFLIGPTNEQEIVYEIVLKAQDAAIRALVPGVPLKNAYQAAVRTLNEKQAEQQAEGLDIPDLQAALTKNVGFAMGIEFRDNAYVLNSKNDAVIEQGMVFNVSVGIQNATDKENGTYSILLADTVFVRDEKRGPDVFTATSRKDFKHISYKITADEVEEDEIQAVEDRNRKTKSSHRNGHASTTNDNSAKVTGAPTGVRGRRRAAADTAQIQETEEEEQRRKKHQEQLAKKMLDRGLSRLKGGDILTIDDAKQTALKLLDEYRAYPTPADFPSLKPRAIVVDMDSEAVIVPINGIPVPFHISALKNATKSDEGQYSYLRVNFHTPQAMVSKGLGRPDNSPKFPGFSVDDGSSVAFIKEFTFRSSNPVNLNDCLRKIKELRKRATEMATVALDKESLVEQQSLVVERGRSILNLQEVSIRPPLAKGKNNVGVLEAHQNGFRYRSRSGSVDIIYTNIRNAFFQEANKELLVLVHFHLKNEIMIGNKKLKDVQFYVQVMEAVVKLNENRRRQFDQDELEEEQRERELRNRTNRNFLKFTKEVEERYGLEFDLPYRQLQFTGAPKSVAVTLLPTVSCIVNLTEWPPFVLNLQDVEVAHFERVILQLRMFDVVFVLRGFEDDPAATGKAAKDMWLRISSIPMEELTPLKRYLDEQNIKYYEGTASLQWNEVLKSIRSDLEGFYESGGWNFLSAEGGREEDGEHSDDEEDSLEGDAEFEPQSDEEFGSGSESSDSDSDASDAVRELEGDSDEGEGELSSGEEGATWEELDRQALREDMRKTRGSDDEGDGRRKRRGGGGGGKRESSRRSGSKSESSRQGERRQRNTRPQVGRKRGRRDG